MRLRKFRVRAYRCIHDSGEITVGDLAAFVGRNESGKTTILQALTLLNRDEKISDLDLCDEMSEELKEEIKLAEGEFDLNEYETEILKEKFPGLPQIKKIKLFRSNRNPKVQYEFEDTEISEINDEGLNSWENFTKEIIDTAEAKADLAEKEKYWISFYNSTDKEIGYNISKGGDGGDTISNNPNRDIITKKLSETSPTKGICYFP